jgi:hypothetical protein
LGSVLHRLGVTSSTVGAVAVSKLYNRSGWAVVYPSELVFGAAVAIVGNLGIAVAMLVPIWFELQSAVVGGFETIVAVVGGFAIMVGDAVVCAVARFSWRCCFFPAFFEIVLAAGCVESGDAPCTVRTGVITVLLFASRVITAAFNPLSVSSISAGNGIPSSLGQSRWSLWLVCLSSSKVPISGLKAVGGGAVGGEAVGRLLTAAADAAVVWEAAHFSRARTFCAAFFQIVSMVTEKGKRHS